MTACHQVTAAKVESHITDITSWTKQRIMLRHTAQFQQQAPLRFRNIFRQRLNYWSGFRSYMCVVAVFDRVSVKIHITATFNLGRLGKKLSIDLCGGQHWKTMAKRMDLCVRGSPRYTHQLQLDFADCNLELESDLALRTSHVRNNQFGSNSTCQAPPQFRCPLTIV